ncbi:MAG: glycosyltransferase [Syntrophobacteraceae bacterium]
MRAPNLSILIPLYNEEQTLIPGVRQLLIFLERENLPAEILLGCNGSTDATSVIGKMLEEALPGRVKFFRIPQRGHLGRVFRIAAEMAASPFLISVDVDMAVDTEFIPRALELLRESHIVVGSKLSGFQHRSAMRNAGTGFYVLCTQALLGLPYDDYSPGAKGYRLDAVKPLMNGISEDTGYVLDILFEADRVGLKVATVPVACRDFRKSRFRLMRLAVGRFVHLFQVWGKNFIRRPSDHQRK